jgi:hypothetical protein
MGFKQRYAARAVTEGTLSQAETACESVTSVTRGWLKPDDNTWQRQLR